MPASATSADPAPTSRAPAPEPVARQLAYQWDLKEVRYNDGRPSFVPKYHTGVTMDSRGGIGWSDGCNDVGGEYTVTHREFSISNIFATQMACHFEEDDVHYDEVTRYSLRGRTLTLYTPTQTYILRRFPYSKMSQNAWSLYSILDRQTGEEFNVDRFRNDFRHLLLEVEEDRRFHFTDLNMDEFTGTLEVRGSTILRMAYDAQSQARLQQRPEQLGHLTDNTQGYRKTKELYPTTFAQRLDWGSVHSFEVIQDTIQQLGRDMVTDVLLFHSNGRAYKFSSR